MSVPPRLLLGIAVIAAAALPVRAGETPVAKTWAAEAPVADPATGLAVAPGWELVRAHCGGCHSYRLITAQRGNHTFWRDTIRWMQRTQNLWEIPAEQERAIVDYLASAYAESEWGRRPGLSPRLLP